MHKDDNKVETRNLRVLHIRSSRSSVNMSSKDFDHQIGKNQVKHDQLKASMEKGDSIRLSSTDQKDDSLIHFGRFGTEQITDQTSPKAKVKKSKSLATLLRKVSRDVLGRDPVMSQVTDQLVTSLDEQKMDSVAGPGTEGPIFCTPGQSEIIRVPLEIINDTELAEGIQGSKTLDSVLQKDWDGLNEAGEFRKVFGNSYESDYHNPFPFLDTDASLEHSKKSVVKPIQVQSATTLSVLAGSRAERSDIFASPASASQLKKKQIAVYHDQHPVIHHIEDAYRTINFGLRTKTTSKLPLHQRASTPSHAVSTSNIESSCHPNNTADMDSVTFLGPKRANTEVSCDSGTSHNQIPSMVDSTRALEMIASVVVPREESKVSNVSEMPLSVADSAVRAIDVEAFSVKRNSMPSISDCNTGIAETGNTKKNHKKNGRKKVKARSTATEDGSTTSTVEGSPIDVKASKQAVFLEKIKKDHHTKYKVLLSYGKSPDIYH